MNGGMAPEETAAFLRGLGAQGTVLQELLRYNESAFVFPPETMRFPLEDEPFVTAWETLVAQAEVSGLFPALKTMLIQLAFPISPGISKGDDYLDATRRGIPPASGPGGGLELVAPESLELSLHQTPAGRLPVLVVRNREDFESLVRAFTRGSEPVPIPASQGACLVAGYNNWGRLTALRNKWKAGWPGFEAESWEACFARIKPRRELYQDRFVILHDGPYSGVPASDLGLPEAEWRRLSLIIRREHEITHYFTKRVLHSMRNVAGDEIIADFMGLRAATGHFRTGWFLRFMGLEDASTCRPGGRLRNYLGTPPLSPEGFAVLAVLVRSAAANLETFSCHSSVSTAAGGAEVMLTLTQLTLIELASADAPERLVRVFDALRADGRRCSLVCNVNFRRSY